MFMSIHTHWGIWQLWPQVTPTCTWKKNCRSRGITGVPTLGIRANRWPRVGTRADVPDWNITGPRRSRTDLFNPVLPNSPPVKRTSTSPWYSGIRVAPPSFRRRRGHQDCNPECPYKQIHTSYQHWLLLLQMRPMGTFGSHQPPWSLCLCVTEGQRNNEPDLTDTFL